MKKIRIELSRLDATVVIVIKRGVQSPIVKCEREEMIDPWGGCEDTKTMTYYQTWVIIDGKRMDVVKGMGSDVWFPRPEYYDDDLESEV